MQIPLHVFITYLLIISMPCLPSKLVLIAIELKRKKFVKEEFSYDQDNKHIEPQPKKNMLIKKNLKKMCILCTVSSIHVLTILHWTGYILKSCNLSKCIYQGNVDTFKKLQIYVQYANNNLLHEVGNAEMYSQYFCNYKAYFF